MPRPSHTCPAHGARGPPASRGPSAQHRPRAQLTRRGRSAVSPSTSTGPSAPPATAPSRPRPPPPPLARASRPGRAAGATRALSDPAQAAGCGRRGRVWGYSVNTARAMQRHAQRLELCAPSSALCSPERESPRACSGPRTGGEDERSKQSLTRAVPWEPESVDALGQSQLSTFGNC